MLILVKLHVNYPQAQNFATSLKKEVNDQREIRMLVDGALGSVW